MDFSVVFSVVFSVIESAGLERLDRVSTGAVMWLVRDV
jgi:hypothetical protein